MKEQKPRDAVCVLAISARADDLVSLAHIFECTRWTMHYVPDRRAALQFLRKSRMPVLICDCQLPDGSWKDLLDDVARLPAPPLLIVTSRLADDCLWMEALDCGAYDVLAQPFDRAEAIRSISLAWRQWKDLSGRAAPAA